MAVEHAFSWMDWGEEAFARARAEKKPVFLHIGATWCHWCHVMDEATYTHAGVATLLRERFIPVRVDTDHRPDVNERYNHGGWPTIAVLDADGQVLAGRLYVPPHELLSLLQSTSDASQRWVVAPAEPEEIGQNAVAVDTIWAHVRKAHDPYNGGFGEFEKFPHTQVCSWVLDRKLRGHDDAGMLAPALAGMATRGMVDSVEGGFFRYATQEDWNVPHYEKLLDDHGRLLTLYLRAGSHRDVVEGAVRWLLATLWQDAGNAFGGSQDADEGYYERTPRVDPPAVDGTIYAGWNGVIAAAFVRAAAAWGRPGLRAIAVRVGETLLAEHVAEDGAVRRTKGGVVGLAEDQAGVAEGFLALWQATGEARWRDGAVRVLDWARRELAHPAGGFVDARPGAIGLTRLTRRPLHQNAALGEAAWRLGALTGAPAWREMAEAACLAALQEADRYGFMGAPAAALRERLDHKTVVVKVRDNRALLDTFLADPHPDVLALAVDTELSPGTALACGPTACARPSADQAEIRRFVEQLRG